MATNDVCDTELMERLNANRFLRKQIGSLVPGV